MRRREERGDPMIGDVAGFRRLLAMARARSGAGDRAEATRLWKQVVAANQVHGSNWASLAAARFEAADYHGAAEAYRKVLDSGCGRRSGSTRRSPVTCRT